MGTNKNSSSQSNKSIYISEDLQGLLIPLGLHSFFDNNQREQIENQRKQIENFLNATSEAAHSLIGNTKTASLADMDQPIECKKLSDFYNAACALRNNKNSDSAAINFDIAGVAVQCTPKDFYMSLAPSSCLSLHSMCDKPSYTNLAKFARTDEWEWKSCWKDRGIALMVCDVLRGRGLVKGPLRDFVSLLIAITLIAEPARNLSCFVPTLMLFDMVSLCEDPQPHPFERHPVFELIQKESVDSKIIRDLYVNLDTFFSSGRIVVQESEENNVCIPLYQFLMIIGYVLPMSGQGSFFEQANEKKGEGSDIKTTGPKYSAFQKWYKKLSEYNLRLSDIKSCLILRRWAIVNITSEDGSCSIQRIVESLMARFPDDGTLLSEDRVQLSGGLSLFGSIGGLTGSASDLNAIFGSLI